LLALLQTAKPVRAMLPPSPSLSPPRQAYHVGAEEARPVSLAANSPLPLVTLHAPRGASPRRRL